MSVVGIDIGGANLKASDGIKSISRSFPLWKSPELLPRAIAEILAVFHPYGPVAATMTGELADCYSTRAIGVQSILAALQSAAPRRQIFVWQTGGEFLTVDDASELPELVAAANWHALATWSGRACPEGNALLIDIGSTTTDLIPISSGLPTPRETTDLGRLCSGELVYSGVRRTPLFSMSPTVNVDSEMVRLAAELFGTSLDVYLLSGDLQEDSECLETANGQPATAEAALVRIARALCSDLDQLSEDTVRDVASQCAAAQSRLLAAELSRVVQRMDAPLQMMISSGEGEFLVSRLIESERPDLASVERLSLNSILGPEHSQSACAYALARLGTELL